MADARWAEVRLERGSFSLRGFLGGSVRAGAKARHGVGRRQIDGIQIPARKRVLIVLLLVEISCVGLWLGVAMRERLRESSSIQESPRLLVEGMAMPPALRINERGWGRFWWAAEEGMSRVPGPVWLADALAAGVMFMLVRRWSIGMDRAPASGRAWGERAWRWVLTDRSDPARVDGRRLPETPEAYPFQGVGRAMLAAMLVWFSLGAALAARNDPLGNWLTPMVLLAAWAGLAGRWFWCGVSAALACAVDSMALWPVAFFVLWPLCGNAPRAATRVIAGWGATTALIVSPWLVRSPLGMLWVAGVALVPVLLKKEWWGRGARKLEVPRSGFAKPQATLEPFARGESGAGGEGVVRQRRPFASTWIAIPVALELILWPLIMPSGQKLDALCAMVGLAILLIGLGRRMSGPWFRCQVAIAVAAGMFACPLLFAGSYKWADGARLGRAAEIVASLNIRQLAEAQFATPRGVMELALPGVWRHSVTLRELLAGICGLMVLMSAAGAARGEMRGSPGLLAAMCVPWLAGAMLLEGGGERWLVVAACLSAAWAARSGEWIIIHLGLAGVALLVSLGARGGAAGAWIDATRPAWIWVVMLGMGVALAGALTARGRRA